MSCESEHKIGADTHDSIVDSDAAFVQANLHDTFRSDELQDDQVMMHGVHYTYHRQEACRMPNRF